MLQQNIKDMRSDEATATCIHYQYTFIETRGTHMRECPVELYL